MHFTLLAVLFAAAALPAMAGVLVEPPVSVPEPATIAVVVAGVGALLMARRRRR